MNRTQLYLITDKDGKKELSSSLRSFFESKGTSYNKVRGWGNKPMQFPIKWEGYEVDRLPEELNRMIPPMIGKDKTKLQDYLQLILSKLTQL